MKRWFVVVAAIAACGDNASAPLAWGVGVQTFAAADLGLSPGGAEPFAGKVHATTRLTLPTYDGSGQVVHPDIVFLPAEGTLPDRLVMAMTPYAYSDDRLENPSLVASTDGNAFLDLGVNPLVPAPPIDHNNDPDLHRDPVTGDYELVYLETLRPETQNLIAMRSADLTTWTARTAIAYDLAAGDPFIVSPAAVVRDGATHLFYVRVEAGIEVIVSADRVTWDRTQAALIHIDTGSVVPWHVDVVTTRAGYAMLISGYIDDFERQSVYLATSPDLVDWSFRAEPLLAWDDPALETETLYRSTGLVIGDALVVWYSMQYRER